MLLKAEVEYRNHQSRVYTLQPLKPIYIESSRCLSPSLHFHRHAARHYDRNRYRLFAPPNQYLLQLWCRAARRRYYKLGLINIGNPTVEISGNLSINAIPATRSSAKEGHSAISIRKMIDNGLVLLCNCSYFP